MKILGPFLTPFSDFPISLMENSNIHFMGGYKENKKNFKRDDTERERERERERGGPSTSMPL